MISVGNQSTEGTYLVRRSYNGLVRFDTALGSVHCSISIKDNPNHYSVVLLLHVVLGSTCCTLRLT